MIRDKLIAAGVRNLKDYGYPHVSADNILSDMIYAGFFKSMLEDNRGQGFDAEIDALLVEIGEPK